MSEEQKSCSPGPWSRRFNGASVIIEDANGKAVARATPRIRGELNGHLIAAAPELLASLDGILQWWMESDGGDDMPTDLFDRAHAAIAKAKGGAL